MKGAKLLMVVVIFSLLVVMFLVFKPSNNSTGHQGQLRNAGYRKSLRQEDDPTYAQEIEKFTILLNDSKRQFDQEMAAQKRRNEALQQKINQMQSNVANQTEKAMDDKTEDLLIQLAEMKKELKQSVAEKDKLLKDFNEKLQQGISEVKNNSQVAIDDMKNKLDEMVKENQDSSLDNILSNNNTDAATATGQKTPSVIAPKEETISYQPYNPIKPAQSGSSTNGSSKEGAGQGSSMNTDQDIADGIFDVIQENIAVGPFKDAEASTKDGNKRTLFPVYTIPMNSFLSDAMLVTPMVGRVPISGNITDPFHFKVIIAKENLAANGHKIPGLDQMIMSGFSVGNKDQSCTRGYITSLTYIFEDGRIVENGNNNAGSANSSDNIGYLVDQWGKPCIRGLYINNAVDYLKSRTAAAFLEGLASAYGQSQITYDSDDNGNYNAYLSGDSYAFAFANGISDTAAELADYVTERQADAFDIVFVPQAQRVGIFIDKQIPIDYDTTARKVNYISQSSGASYD